MNKFLKRLAILALATVTLLGMKFASAAAPNGGAGNPDTSSTAPPRHSTTAKTTTHRRVATTHRGTHHPRVARDPWQRSSYANPGAGDDPTGDDPVVRQAAVEALGKISGSMVVVDPNTGRILSIVNQKLALSSGFTPCSTFKPVVALATIPQVMIPLCGKRQSKHWGR
ncbi:MAG: penicillin-binding transpeptidase domain-containing protein [Acidobacteriota bacterium]|nr:penicillin-binding transpeptidase domain-containing protein [Acidobacteriota bacterium]